MFEIISGSNMNQLTLNAYSKILQDGRRQTSRNGDIMCINNAVLNLEYPQSRHLYLEGRKSHIAAQIAETFWVMAGEDRVDPYLSFFLPRAKNYSDNGKIWYGAYGKRLYAYKQLEDAVDVFVKEGWDTRRSIIQILLPELDSRLGLEENGIDPDNAKDRPCNNELVFFMTPQSGSDNVYELNMNVFQRSGDAIWGALNINVFEWTFLMELMVGTLNSKMEETIVIGEYTHFVTNLHIYDFTSEQAKEAVSKNWSRDVGRSFNTTPMTCTGDVYTDRKFFIELVDFLSNAIEGNIGCDLIAMGEIFERWSININNNQLWDYAITVLFFIAQKRGIFNSDSIVQVVNGVDYRNCLNQNTIFKGKAIL